MPDNLTASVAELRRLRDAASPLPWRRVDSNGMCFVYGPEPWSIKLSPVQCRDADYLAAAANLAPALADECERLLAENERLKATLNAVRHLATTLHESGDCGQMLGGIVRVLSGDALKGGEPR